MTSGAEAAEPSKRLAQTGAERQRRHRQSQKLHVLEVKDETYAQLQTICAQKHWTMKQAVAEGMKLLLEQLAAETRMAQLAEAHRHAAEEQAKFDQAYPLPPEKPRKPRPPPAPEEVEGQGSLL